MGRYGTADIPAAWANKGDDPVEGRMPTYYAGDTIKVTFVFQGAPGIRSVTAAFSHEEEPDGIDLRGDASTEQAAAEGGQSYWQVELTTDVFAEDTPGIYVCEVMV